MNRQCGAIPVVAGDNRSLEWSYCAVSSCRCIPNYGDDIHDNVHSRNFVEMEEGYP